MAHAVPLSAPAVMTPRPASAMTEDEAAWIREHAWTTPMRKGYIETPGFYTHCACQWTGPCENDPRPGVHERCHVGRIPMPQYETVITTRNERIAYLREPYRHPTASATGWHHTAVAQVWLARHLGYAPRPPDGQSVVYVLFDEANVPCYVGSTQRFKGRLQAHERDKKFRRWVAYPCTDREAAYQLEERLLREHKPYLNKKASR